jgi:hypothetical protein
MCDAIASIVPYDNPEEEVLSVVELLLVAALGSAHCRR